MFTASGCEKFVEAGIPKNELVADAVFTDDKTAISAMDGIYSRMMTDGFASGFYNSISVCAGLTADELIGYGAEQLYFYQNSILPSSSNISVGLWKQPYSLIYTTNSILEGLASTNGISNEVKTQLRGEALFVRSFIYFYLVNLYNDIPFYTKTDYQANIAAGKTAKADVLKHIEEDLLEAKALLSADFIVEDRVRPNKYIVAALLARLYLYNGEWDKAITESTFVLNNAGVYEIETDISRVFLADSKETIWHLIPVLPNTNTNEANIFTLTDIPSFVSLDPALAHFFEQQDLRRTQWIDSIVVGTDVFFYPKKYKVLAGEGPVTEYEVVLRLAEQLLIRAEANANLNHLSEAEADINILRSRAGVSPINGLAQNELLGAIATERRLELFTEWGHRWFDLIRTNQATAVLSQNPEKSWQETDIYFPIAQEEINANPQVDQNHGY
ncbi:MAG: RagB/SusD family nutrient uptake outer membrane protein [Chitinophagaceae bacterium]|nr:RagB/SusD family nutrient uptake outer membrane protein [Chitinophagaceae bacterium]